MTPTNFQEILQQKLLERTGNNRDLIEEKNSLQSEMSSLPAMLRASGELSAIRNPLERESIYSQRVNNIGSRLGTVTDLLGQRGQRFSDILNSANSAYGDYLNEQQARRSGGGGGGGMPPWISDYLNSGNQDGAPTPDMGRTLGRAPIVPKKVSVQQKGFDPRYEKAADTYLNLLTLGGWNVLDRSGGIKGALIKANKKGSDLLNRFRN